MVSRERDDGERCARSARARELRAVRLTQMARAFVIVNPAAGGGRTRRLWPGIRDHLHHLGVTFEFGETTGRDVATAMARAAVRDGWPLVVAVGGDGTINEVINGLVDDGGAQLVCLGAIA